MDIIEKLRYLCLIALLAFAGSAMLGQNIKDLQTKANNGSVSAQMELAQCYIDGNGVDVNPEEAVSWCSLAAEQGYSEAVNMLKLMADDEAFPAVAYAKYHQGKLCITLDKYFDAEKYLYESYQLGYYESACELGYLYYYCDHNGGSIRTNTAENLSIIRSNITNKSNAEADFRNRKHRYENDNAEYWFNVTIIRGLDNDNVLWHLCNIYTNNGDYKNAAISLERFLSTGNYFNGPCADYLRLADLYLLSGYKINRAFEIYKERLEAIETNADSDLNDNDWYNWIVCGLGKCYYEGVGTNQSYEAAVKYFKYAADNDDPEGLQLLSRCYRFGRGVSRNISIAESLMQKAQKLEDPTAIRIRTMLE